MHYAGSSYFSHSPVTSDAVEDAELNRERDPDNDCLHYDASEDGANIGEELGERFSLRDHEVFSTMHGQRLTCFLNSRLVGNSISFAASSKTPFGYFG